MGFPDSFRIPVSDTRAYRQFGNSVVVPLFVEIAKLMRPLLVGYKEASKLNITMPDKVAPPKEISITNG